MHPAASVTINDPDTVITAEMVMYMHYYFIGDTGYESRHRTVDHGTGCIDPWARRLRSLGVTIETSSPVPGLRIQDDRVVGTTDRDETYDWVVLATSIPGLKAVVDGSQVIDSSPSAPLAAVRSKVAQLKVAKPYQVVRVWFDRTV